MYKSTVLMGPCRSAPAVGVPAVIVACPATPGGNLGENGNQKRTAAPAAVRGKSADNPRTVHGQSQLVALRPQSVKAKASAGAALTLWNLRAKTRSRRAKPSQNRK